MPPCALFYTPAIPAPGHQVVFDNSPCQIDEARRTEVNQAHGEISAFLAAIEEGSPALSFTPPAECNVGDATATIDSVSGLALHRGVIEYQFRYSGTCTHRECHDETVCDPTCRTVQVCNDSTISFSGITGSETYVVPSGAPGMRIDSPPRSKAGFTEAINAWEQFVNDGLDLSAHKFGSSDADTDDEFMPVLNAVDAFIADDALPFRTAIKDFVDAMAVQEALLAAPPVVPTNPVTYAWTDTQGAHDVTAEVGPFVLARTKKTSSGFLIKTVCIKLKDYDDPSGSRTWVKITRRDPAGKELGFWRWSPIPLTTTRLSRSAYSFNYVNLAGTR